MRRSEKNVSEQKAAIERNGEATLLVVDDEPEIVALLDEYFTGLGYRVLTAEDGATALKRAEQSPDLIVLDVGMPLMDGYAVCRRLREHLTCPILFLTARVDGDIAIDYRSRTVTAAGRPVELTRREFDIVAFLSKHPGQVFDRDRIHERVGGWENESDSQVVTEHIRRIRKKLAAAGAEPDPVETVWGMGYRWRA